MNVDLVTQLEQVLERYGVLNNRAKVIIAVSGGVDSVVLLHLIQSISTAKRPKIIVAHINHKLRPESKQEENLVREQAQIYGLPFYMRTWPKTDHPSSGIEEAARNVRYNFLKELMLETKSDSVMTAHHQDDQVETILMKLTRGSTLEQMTGIEESQPFDQGLLIRPLLSMTKEEIYQYAESNNLVYMEDSSNQTLDYTRNRFRNLILPLFKDENEQFNSQIIQFKLDLEDLLAISNAPINQEFTELVSIQNDQIAFHQEELEAFNEPMQRALLRKMLDTVYEGKEQRYKTNYIALIQEWLRDTDGNSHLQLAGGVMVEKSYQNITIYHSTATTDLSKNPTPHILLDEISQTLPLSESETIELRNVTQEELDNLSFEDLDMLIFEADQLKFPLTIRHRLPGDRMQYNGLTGSKKIKDIFIDEKTPLKERDKAWLVEDATGKIVWLIGYRKMYLLSPTETDKLTYILKYNH